MPDHNKKYRAAILGAGHISPFHVAGIRRSNLAEVVAVCDLDVTRASALAERHGIEHVVKRIDDLKDLAIDVIHIATPPSTHFPLTIEALDVGCHVLVEKPLATSVTQCESIARRAAEVNRQVCTNHSNLLDPFVARTIQLARAGKIGDVLSATYLRSSNYPPYGGGPLPPHYREGGFPFRDLGVHALYLFRALLGEIRDVETKFAHRGEDPLLYFDDWTGTVNCERGTGLFHLSWNSLPLQNVLIVTGTRGVIRCDQFSMFVSTRRKTKLPGAVDRILGPLLEGCQILTQVPYNICRVAMKRLRRYHGVQAMIGKFYSNLLQGLPAPVGIDDATEAVRWTEHAAQPADQEKQRRLARIPKASGADLLVTGATGFIGRHLLNRLLERGDRVRILTRQEPSPDMLSDSRLEMVVGDLGDEEVVNRAVDGTRLVYHLGAAMKGATEDFQRGTELGTRHVIEAVLRQTDARLVYISSLSVLRASLATSADVVTEAWPLEPYPQRRGNYSLFKLRAEKLVSDAVRDRGLRAVIIRPGQVFGPGAELLTPAVARRTGSRLVVLGDGSVPLPLVFVEDLVDALLAAEKLEPFDGTVIQIVDDSVSIDQNELLGRMLNGNRRSIIHIPRPIVYGLALAIQLTFGSLGRPAPLSIYRVRSALSKLHFDSSKARSLLDWAPQVGVEGGLKQCLNGHATDTLRERAQGTRHATSSSAVETGDLV